MCQTSNPCSPRWPTTFILTESSIHPFSSVTESRGHQSPPKSQIPRTFLRVASPLEGTDWITASQTETTLSGVCVWLPLVVKLKLKHQMSAFQHCHTVFRFSLFIAILSYLTNYSKCVLTPKINSCQLTWWPHASGTHVTPHSQNLHSKFKLKKKRILNTKACSYVPKNKPTLCFSKRSVNSWVKNPYLGLISNQQIKQQRFCLIHNMISGNDTSFVTRGWWRSLHLQSTSHLQVLAFGHSGWVVMIQNSQERGKGRSKPKEPEQEVRRIFLIQHFPCFKNDQPLHNKDKFAQDTQFLPRSCGWHSLVN